MIMRWVQAFLRDVADLTDAVREEWRARRAARERREAARAPQKESAPPVPDALRAMLARGVLPCGHLVAALGGDAGCGACVAEQHARVEAERAQYRIIDRLRGKLAAAESERMAFHGDATRERNRSVSAEKALAQALEVVSALRGQREWPQREAGVKEPRPERERPMRTWWLCPGSGPGGRSEAPCEGGSVFGKEGECCPNCGREKVAYEVSGRVKERGTWRLIESVRRRELGS